MAFEIDDILSKLTQQEKISLLSGIDIWHTHPIPQHNVPSVRFTDGPNGVRGTRFFPASPATCLPCGTAMAATWDTALLTQAGRLLGKECIGKGAHCLLGPTLDIMRSPLSGRGFEGFGEDPYLIGVLASSLIHGCHDMDVATAVKHFVAYSQESQRRRVNAIVTERALREIYLRPFQIVARDARPAALVTSYNKVNGKHVSQSRELLDGIVRQEWKWDPLILSDWFGTYSTAEAMKAGLDLEMPGLSRHRGRYIQYALDAGDLTQSTLDARVRKVVEFACQARRTPSIADLELNTAEDRALNRRLCSSGIVLLKNDDAVLPLSTDIKSIALIGSHMKRPAVCGGGSAQLEPHYTVSLYDALLEELSPATSITFQTGQYVDKVLPAIDRLLVNGALEFYNSPPTVQNRRSLGQEFVSSTAFKLMDYNGMAELNKQCFWATLTGDFIPDTSGPWEFGLSVYGSGTFYLDDELLIDNTTEQRPGTAFFGKGTAQEHACKEVNASQRYTVRVEFGSASTSVLHSSEHVNFAGGALHLGARPKLDWNQMIDDAIHAAKHADCTILCTGLTDDWESEGFDRPHMDLPPNIDELISGVLRVCPNAVIINHSGSPVTMPWADQAKCILQAWYGGNETGHAIADVLFGRVNPSGRLPFSWPLTVKDNPAYLNFGAPDGRVLYGEDIYVGYRYYEKMDREVLFPFGHGLSYTAFQLSELRVIQAPDDLHPRQGGLATMLVRNIGPVPGAEILQLYIGHSNVPSNRPVKELHGFCKVFLDAGEAATVEIPIDPYAGSVWDEVDHKWVTAKGICQVYVGRSSREILGTAVFEVKDERHWMGI
ncbi:putative beta-glucosidase [Aspergillus coremiiformis]|uniref:Probable beta-glucosidase H n=1 Tax=Aspergillus coremiiformis TaxID=138285 RepID=A0A5N6ZBF0_9EURO|nr:putative beta-glucosidase [Aspergillus coremiiformis]